MAPTLNLAHTKVSKKERAEFATIEEKVEELELLAVEAQKALDDANAMARRPSQSAILELAGQVSAAALASAVTAAREPAAAAAQRRASGPRA